jgi:hypothetical protein
MPRQAPSAPVQRVVGGGARQPARVPGPRSGAQPIVASGALPEVIWQHRLLDQLCPIMLFDAFD